MTTNRIEEQANNFWRKDEVGDTPGWANPIIPVAPGNGAYKSGWLSPTTPKTPTKSSTKSSQFFDTFQKCEKVLAEREAEYKGSADGMFEDIGELAKLLLPDNPTPGQQAAATLLALKLVRMKANPKHGDSVVDCCNYLLWFHKELLK